LLKGISPSHPGAILREDVLPALGRSKTEVATLLGNGPELWITLQRKFDIYIAERVLAKEIAKIPTLSAA